VRVAVFAGSAPGGSPAFARAAAAFGGQLARAGAGIVYGGSHAGLMGVLADAALAAGGEVTGVIPRGLVEREIAHQGLTRLEIVQTMHERKTAMASMADAFVALPGGAGTLEEFFEAWTWQQLGLHAKPVALLDVDGFWEPLLATIDGLVDAGFLRPAYRAALLVVRDADELLAALGHWRPPPVKWDGAGGARPPLRAVGWLHVRDGRLLVVRSRGRDAFYLPGGKYEAGETGRQALVREVREEVGVELREDALTEAFVVEDVAHGQGGLRLRMTCYSGDGRGEPRPGREIEEIAWVTPDQGDRCAAAVRQVLRRLHRLDQPSGRPGTKAF
jgi:uncharacterized protein (TIGR00730 family)